MPDLETALFEILAATAVPSEARPAPRQVTEAATFWVLLSDPEVRWFRPAVAA
jgi:hypothetical protein